MNVDVFGLAASRWWWVILLAGAIGASAAYIVSIIVPPVYEASATLLIRPFSEGGRASYESDVAVQRIAGTSRELLTKSVLASRLQSPIFPDSLAGSVKVRHLENTELLQLDARAGSPDAAALVANAVSEEYLRLYEERETERYDRVLIALLDEAEELQKSLAIGITGHPSVDAIYDAVAEVKIARAAVRSELTIVVRARSPERPIQPRVTLNTLIGGAMGIVLSTVMAAVFQIVWGRAEQPSITLAKRLSESESE